MKTNLVAYRASTKQLVPTESEGVRLLFIHAALDHLSAEYKVHKGLAESASLYGIESYFLWQRGSRTTGDNSMTFSWPERVHYVDFGRDISVTPLPNRQQRALMVVRSLPGAFLAMLDQMRKIQPDLLYTSQQRYDMILARILARLFHVPHVIHLHYSVGPWLGSDVLRAIRRSHHLIAISQFIRQTALLQGIDASAISTVPNSIGPEAFRQSVDRASMRAEFGWDHDTPVLISAGRLDPMKGHHRLIEVFSQVLARLPQARLLICGRTLNRSDYPDFLRQRVADLGIQHAVVFTGHRYDLPSLMQEADVFSLLSEMEPFGLVFLEAMAVGLPVATYYSGSVPEIIIDGVTGFISDPDQPAVLVNNLVRLLSDRSLAGQMGTAGQKRAADIFSPEVITPRWVDTLRRYALKAPVPLTAR